MPTFGEKEYFKQVPLPSAKQEARVVLSAWEASWPRPSPFLNQLLRHAVFHRKASDEPPAQLQGQTSSRTDLKVSEGCLFLFI